ncbi:SHOCT domain-containing protein [Nonomuraea sp. NPDC050536]|uniref:SHOCT domain-containing protein n=1 Tax=Nonomuraea sp. NPDC050536 TaxID=3364366 RepID=UPI0037C9275A
MSDYPLLNVFWTTFVFFLWILWFFLLFRIITDIFRSDDMNGWAKAAWIVFVIILPFLGVLVYVIARGKSMTQRDVERSRQSEAAFRAYVRDAAQTETSGPSGPADQLAQLATLHAQGVLNDEEFQRAKDKLLV